MKKRIFSFLLFLCLLVTALPVFTLPSVASEAKSSSAGGEKNHRYLPPCQQP